MSDVINVTIKDIVDVINITVEEQPPIKVSFYNEAIPDERVIKAVIDSQEARDAAIQARNETEILKNQAATSEANAFASAESASTSETNAFNSASAASDSEANALQYKNDAELSAQNASDSEANALSYKNDAEASAMSADSSKTAAQGSASSASNSALLAQQAADSVLFNDVIFITSAMSPVEVEDIYRGAMLACDSSGGEIEIILPKISELDLSFPWTVSIKKTDSSGNPVKVKTTAPDTVDGFNEKVIQAPNSGLTLIPDVDPEPDTWTSAEFGASAGNIITNEFSGDGVETEFELSTSPGSKNSTNVYIYGVYQKKSSYSLIDNVIIFNDPPPVGVDNIEVTIGAVLPIGTPSDDSVILSKLTQSVIDQLVPAGVILDFGGPLANVPMGYLPVDNSVEYNASEYPRLARAFWDEANQIYVHGGEGIFPNGKFRTPPAGYFKRGIDPSGVNDPDAATRTASSIGGATGNNVGAVQEDAIQRFNFNQAGSGTLRGNRLFTTDNVPNPATRPFSDITSGLRFGTDTRPKNYLVAQIVKY